MVTGDEEPQSEDALKDLIVAMLEGIPRFFVGAEIPKISDNSRMAADQAATQSLRFDMAVVCAHYLDISAEPLGSLHQLMLPQPPRRSRSHRPSSTPVKRHHGACTGRKGKNAN